MPFSITRPAGRRSSDVRALRWRFVTITFSGNYATGGEVINATQFGLRRILMVVPQGAFLGDPATPGAGYTVPVYSLNAAGTVLTIKQMEDNAGAAGAPFGAEKNNTEAYISPSVLNLVLVGE